MSAFIALVKPLQDYFLAESDTFSKRPLGFALYSFGFSKGKAKANIIKINENTTPLSRLRINFSLKSCKTLYSFYIIGSFGIIISC